MLLALASAYMLWRFWHGRSGSLDSLPKGKKVWLGCLAVLLVCVSVYPVLGTHDRLGVRFDHDGPAHPPTAWPSCATVKSTPIDADQST